MCTRGDGSLVASPRYIYRSCKPILSSSSWFHAGLDVSFLARMLPLSIEVILFLTGKAKLLRYLFKHLVATPNQLTAGALVMSYWLSSDRVSPAVWITVFLVIIVFANWFAVRFLGEFEFWLSSFKIAVIAGLMVLSLVLALGGGPDRDRKGFRYWKQPGSFAIAGDGSNGHVKRLSAVWKTLPSTTFAYIGTELIGMRVSQSENPPKFIRHAVRITSYRILVFHILSAILLGMIVPYNCERLAFASHASESAPASAFVAAIEIAGIAVLPDLLNACILVFVLAAANSSLFMAVRTIYGLSRENQAPALFSRTDRRGIPIYSLGACSLLASLAFMSTSENSKIVFGYFVNLVTILGLLIWISVLITHISFIRARKAQKVPDEALAFKAPLGSCGSWAALISCVTISLTKSVDLFNGNEFPGGFDYVGFITSYLGIPLYLGLLIGYKMATKCKRVRSVEVDLSTGKYEFDIREADNPENVEARGHPQDGPSSWLDRIVKYVK